MLITPSTLDAIFFTFNKRFQDAFDAQKVWYDQVATEMPSPGAENRYAWMDKLPRLREWLGERQVQNVAANGYTLANKDFEATIGVPRNTIKDDQLGVFSPIVDQLGQQAKKWPDDLISAAMQSTTNLSWDGQYFWDTDHPIDINDSSKGTYQNVYSSGKALTPANFDFARYTMRTFKGLDGRPLMVDPTHLVVPPQLETTARQIVQADFVAPAGAVGSNAANAVQRNVLANTVQVLVIPELANEATAWYLLDCGKAIKPFVFQLREQIHFESLTDPSSPNVFYRKEFIYGCSGRGAAGYTMPFLAMRLVA